MLSLYSPSFWELISPWQGSIQWGRCRWYRSFYSSFYPPPPPLLGTMQGSFQRLKFFFCAVYQILLLPHAPETVLIPVGGDANISCSYVMQGIRPRSVYFWSYCTPCITRAHEGRYTFDLVVTNFRAHDAGEAYCRAVISYTKLAYCYFNVTAAGEHDHYYILVVVWAWPASPNTNIKVAGYSLLINYS